MSQPKPVLDALKQSSSQRLGNFPFIQLQVAQWQKLTKMIQPYLPPQGSWQVVCYQNGTLTITGDNQALISQMRYLQSQYLSHLKEALPVLSDLQKIQVLLQTPLETKEVSKKYTRKRQFSNSTQEQLQQIADIVKDPKLSQALLRLASPQDKNSPDNED